MIRGDDAGLEANFADGWLKMSVCVAVGTVDDSGKAGRNIGKFSVSVAGSSSVV